MSRLTRIAVQLNNFRIIPRLALVFYLVTVAVACKWFMALEMPSAEQAAFVAALIGAGATFSSLYLKSGSIMKENDDG